jgi:hypothetical protein
MEIPLDFNHPTRLAGWYSSVPEMTALASVNGPWL